MSGNYIQSYLNTGHGLEPARNFTIYASSSISIITGFYNIATPTSASLTDVSTSATITIINSPTSLSYQLDPNYSNYFYILQSGAYTFEISYTDTAPSPNITYTTYVSFTAVIPVALPATSDLYKVIKRSEPQSVYTQTISSTDNEGNLFYTNEYVDSNSTATVLSTLYEDVNSVYENIVPTGGASNWELTLNNTVGLLSNTPTPGLLNPYYSLILDMLYSLLVNNTGNKFDVSFFLSKYLWYRSNKTISSYVYIQEVTNVLPAVWILGVSTLGNTTILGGDIPPIFLVSVYIIPQSGTITQDLQNEITSLVPRLFPDGYAYQVFFNETLSSLGLTVNLNQTWKSDPRLYAFAIEYISTDVNQTNGYSNPTGNAALLSIAMSPASGTVLAPGTSSYTITATYFGGVTSDVTLLSSVTSSDSSIISLPTPGTFSANMAGAATISFSYGIFSGENNYTVS